MPPGIKKLQRIQWGKEVTPGTAVPATTRWRGAGNLLDDQRTIEEIEETIGIIEGADRTATVSLFGQIELAEVPLTPEQIGYLAAMAFGGPTTGAQDGTGSDYIYTTNIPTTARPSAVPYTIEAGDDFEVQRMEYALCTKFSIKFEMKQTARVSGTLTGRQVARYATGFAAAAIPDVSELPAQKAKIYLDAIGGAYGTTQVSNTIIAGQIDYEVMWQPRYTASGNLYPDAFDFTGYKVTGSLTFLHDTAGGGQSGALYDWRQQLPKLLRIDVVGDQVATPGTTYQNKQVIFDLPIKYNASPGSLTDKDGNNIYSMKFRSRYNTTAGNAGKIIAVNELTTLP